VAQRLEAALSNDVLLLPVQWLGASAHHLGMAGTLSATPQTCLRLVEEPLRCLLQHGFRRAFVLNGHGGNTDVFHLALRQLASEFPETLLGGAAYWDVAAAEIAALLQGKLKGVGHACEFETALMLYLHPELVRTTQIADDGLPPAPEALRGVYLPLDMRRQTKHGGHGEPSRATADTGQALLQAISTRLMDAVQALRAKPLPNDNARQVVL
jgi:creatinine amidohydrolase